MSSPPSRLVLDPDACVTLGRPWRTVKTPGEAARRHAGGRGLLLAIHAEPLLRGLRAFPQGNRLGLLLLEEVLPGDRALLQDAFANAVLPGAGLRLLPTDDLVEVLSSPEAADRFVAGAVGETAGTLLLYRGDLTTLRVPLPAFEPTAEGTRPDFSDFELIDCGYAVRFGAYEATADAILYEHAPDFRRRLDARRKAEERTLGASIRRLRIQRGLRRDDFAPLSSKELARIERSEVRPRPATLAAIARRLRVGAGELGSY